MTGATGQELGALDTEDAIRAVLRETLELLRAALESVLGDDDSQAYGLTEPT